MRKLDSGFLMRPDTDRSVQKRVKSLKFGFKRRGIVLHVPVKQKKKKH